jgi:hypothetical protein
MKALAFVVALAATAALAPSPAAAVIVEFQAFLDGPSEDPANASPGTGFAYVAWDTVAHTLQVNANFQGLTGTTTAAHIHAATPMPLQGIAAVATQTPSFIGFPLGVTSGTFSNTYDLTLASSYRPGFITASGGTPAGAEAALLTALQQQRAYFNIHSTTFPGGEIRGFLTAVPEPGTWALMILGFGAAGVLLRRRRTAAA